MWDRRREETQLQYKVSRTFPSFGTLVVRRRITMVRQRSAYPSRSTEDKSCFTGQATFKSSFNIGEKTLQRILRSLARRQDAQ
jgi:hypothetical protein